MKGYIAILVGPLKEEKKRKKNGKQLDLRTYVRWLRSKDYLQYIWSYQFDL